MLLHSLCVGFICVAMSYMPPAADSLGNPKPMTADEFQSHALALGLEGERQADAATVFSDYAFKRAILDQAYRAWQNWSVNNAPHHYGAIVEDEARIADDEARHDRLEEQWSSGIRRLEDEYFARLADALPAQRDAIVILAQARLRAWAMPDVANVTDYHIAAGATLDLVGTLKRLNVELADDSTASQILADYAVAQAALLRELDQEQRTRGQRLRPFGRAIRKNLEAIRASGLESKHPLMEADAQAWLPTYRWPRELRSLNLRTVSSLKDALDADSFAHILAAANAALHPYVFDHAGAASMLEKSLARSDLLPQQRDDLRAIAEEFAAETDAALNKLGVLYDRLMSDESFLERHRTNLLVYLYTDQAPPEFRPGQAEFEAAAEAWKAAATKRRQQVLDMLTPSQRKAVQE